MVDGSRFEVRGSRSASGRRFVAEMMNVESNSRHNLEAVSWKCSGGVDVFVDFPPAPPIIASVSRPQTETIQSQILVLLLYLLYIQIR